MRLSARQACCRGPASCTSAPICSITRSNGASPAGKRDHGRRVARGRAAPREQRPRPGSRARPRGGVHCCSVGAGQARPAMGRAELARLTGLRIAMWAWPKSAGSQGAARIPGMDGGGRMNQPPRFSGSRAARRSKRRAVSAIISRKACVSNPALRNTGAMTSAASSSSRLGS